MPAQGEALGYAAQRSVALKGRQNRFPLPREFSAKPLSAEFHRRPKARTMTRLRASLAHGKRTRDPRRL